MKLLSLVRHAKSSWKDAQISDFDRPLNKRGKRDAPRMGRRFAQDEDLRTVTRVPHGPGHALKVVAQTAPAAPLGDELGRHEGHAA
jgi:hypothetical protein